LSPVNESVFRPLRCAEVVSQKLLRKRSVTLIRLLCLLRIAAHVVQVSEKRRCPELDVDVGDLVRQLHRRRHHVKTLLCVARLHKEMSQQNQGAGCESVQILGVGHLQSFPQEALGFRIMILEEGFESLDVISGGPRRG